VSRLGSIYRHIFAISFGLIVSFFVAALVTVLWSPLFWPTFLGLSAGWLFVSVTVIRKQHNGTNAVVFDGSQNWRTTDLPAEFQFIKPDTTIGEITRKVGGYSKLRGEGDIQAAQFNLPNKCAVLVFGEPPFRPESRVRGIKFYRDRDFIELFP
jgi:hypothetical protein